MNNFDKKIDNYLQNFEALASLSLRFILGIAFIIYGSGKFPLPPEVLWNIMIYTQSWHLL